MNSGIDRLSRCGWVGRILEPPQLACASPLLALVVRLLVGHARPACCKGDS